MSAVTAQRPTKARARSAATCSEELAWVAERRPPTNKARPRSGMPRAEAGAEANDRRGRRHHGKASKPCRGLGMLQA